MHTSHGYIIALYSFSWNIILLSSLPIRTSHFFKLFYCTCLSFKIDLAEFYRKKRGRCVFVVTRTRLFNCASFDLLEFHATLQLHAALFLPVKLIFLRIIVRLSLSVSTFKHSCAYGFSRSNFSKIVIH
jgi:hypothetical protein